MADLSVMGLFIGQIMGRWGNFVNQEAYGGACDLPWRMGLIVDGQLITVHPTFLYESLWNLMGLCLLFFVVRRVRRFDGEMFLCYLGWYGLGRFWIEGLRTDSRTCSARASECPSWWRWCQCWRRWCCWCGCWCS